MRSVWSRVACGSITVVSPAVLRPASRMALLTCAEATGRRYSIGTISSVPMMASGMRPPSRASKRAPMRDSGSITRCIGRRRSEASPVMKLVKGWLARMPESRRAEVPELPSSSTSAGSRPPPTPKPRIRQVASPASCTTSAPSARKAAAVHSTSSPSSRPRTVVSPSARAPNISARCETDLSPGARTRPFRQATGRATSLAEALADRAASSKDGGNATRRPRTFRPAECGRKERCSSMPEFGFDRVKDA